MSKREAASHPFNAFLVKYGIEQTHLVVMEAGASGKRVACKNLLWLIAWFEREAKANLEKELKELRSKIVLTSEEQELWNIVSSIADQLHDAGYFLDAKGIDRSDKSEKNEPA
jgi:hypothetical protein